LTAEQLASKMPAIETSAAAFRNESTPAMNAVAAAGNDDTPAYVVSTRRHLGEHRRNNRDTMSRPERKRAARVFTQLSRPHNATLLNELRDTADMNTPERMENLLTFAEDMEDDE
jgi:hypothetical protein